MYTDTEMVSTWTYKNNVKLDLATQNNAQGNWTYTTLKEERWAHIQV